MKINNCNTCDYHKLDRKHNDEVGAHCYMFRTEHEHVCHQHTERDAPDVQYIASIYASPQKTLANDVHREFVSTYGSRAVPVSSQHQVTTLQRYSSNFTPIIVSEAHEAMIKVSSDYTAPSKDKITESTPLSYIEDSRLD